MVALLGLIAGIAMPSFLKSLRHAKVSSTANRLYLGLIRARSLAMKSQRPVLVVMTFNAAPDTLTFKAYFDNDFASGSPGPSAGPSPSPTPTQDDPVSRTNTAGDPFGPAGQLALSASDFSFGYPSNASGSYSRGWYNLPLAQNWFEFDAAGRLLPNGQPPFTPAQDITQTASLPDPAYLTGPEFYFAEADARAVRTPRGHVYRKVEISPFGAARVTSWDATTQRWKGVQ